MPDPTLKNVIETLRTNREENTREISSVRGEVFELGINMREDIIALAKALGRPVGFDSRTRGKILEEKREEKNKKASVQQAANKSDGGGGLGLMGLMGLGGLSGMLIKMSGFGLGIIAALEGLRGWELVVIKNFKSIGKALGGAFKFAFTPITWLLEGIGTRFKKIDTWMGNAFVTMGTQIGGVFKDLKAGATKLVSPLMNVTKSITTWMADSKLFKWLKTMGLTMGSKAGAVGGAVGTIAKKVLWPLGILFSAWEAFKAWENSDEGASLAEKFSNAGFAFLGSFIGAPLDLLKDGVSWIFDKFLGNDNWISKTLDSFKFEDTIREIPQMVMRLWDKIVEIFSDPVGVAKDVWAGIKNFLKEAFMNVIRGAFSIVPEWLKPSWLKTENEKALNTTISERNRNTTKIISAESELAQLQRNLDKASQPMYHGEQPFIKQIDDMRAKGLKISEKQQKLYDKLMAKTSGDPTKFMATSYAILAKTMELSELQGKQTELNDSIKELKDAMDAELAGGPTVIDASTNNSEKTENNTSIAATVSSTNDALDYNLSH